MKLTIYQIDAFAERPFEGNPAAVIPLQEWLDDEVMQSISEENNLSETVFFVPVEDRFHIRWFTPTKEVDLCGHATLASAYVLFNCLDYAKDTIFFDSLSGPLSVSENDSLLTLDFPARPPQHSDIPPDLSKGLLPSRPAECLFANNYIAVFDTQQEVLDLKPDYEYLKKLDLGGVTATAPGDPSSPYDFVARFFAPKYGILEDPVTGSAYTELMPYWTTRLGKQSLNAKQLSKRGGKLYCELKEDRVLISGAAVKYMQGFIEI